MKKHKNTALPFQLPDQRPGAPGVPIVSKELRFQVDIPWVWIFLDASTAPRYPVMGTVLSPGTLTLLPTPPPLVM